MEISRKFGFAGGMLWAHLRRAMRLETWSFATQVGAMKSVRSASFSASLLTQVCHEKNPL